MKKKFITLLVCGMLCLTSIVGCSGGSDGKGGANGSSGSHNAVKYVNDSSKKSEDKIALACEDLIITLDSKGIFKEEFSWGGQELKNSVINIHSFSSGNYELNVNIGDFSVLSRHDYDRLDEEKMIVEDGRWLLAKGNTSDSYEVHYAYKNDKKSYKAVVFDIFSTEDVEIAKEKFEKLKSIVNVYLSGDDYVNAKDADGNSVSLADYHFVQDIMADIMVNECSMYVADAYTIKSLRTGKKIRIEILDEAVEKAYYDIELCSKNHNADMKADAEFKLNGKQVFIYEGRERVFVQLEENSFLMFEYNIGNDDNLKEGGFKDVFIKHFK